MGVVGGGCGWWRMVVVVSQKYTKLLFYSCLHRWMCEVEVGVGNHRWMCEADKWVWWVEVGVVGGEWY